MSEQQSSGVELGPAGRVVGTVVQGDGRALVVENDNGTRSLIELPERQSASND
jgi:hypothetical protein